MRRPLLTSLIAAAVIGGPISTASANDFAAGLAVGIIGSAVAADIKRKNQRRSTSTRRAAPRRSSISTAQRAENRSIQTSLNYFGFNAGGADGVLGKRSRAAAAAYQVHLGYPATGYLNEFEKNFLLTSYNRAIAGGPNTTAQIAKLGGAPAALLIAYRDEASGGAPRNNYGGLPDVVAATVDEIAQSSDPTGEQLIQRAGFIQLSDMNGDGRTDYLIDTSVTGSAFWCNAQSCAVRVFVSTPNGHERNDFQAFNVTPAMFNCNRGLCEMPGAAQGGTVLAGAQQVAPQAGTTLVTAAVPTPNTGTLPVPTAVPSVQTAAPAAPATGGLPTFLAKPQGQASLASHCNTVSLVTNTNGGFTTLAGMNNPETALNEQFCLARTYAIAGGEALMSKVTGVSAAEVEAQCAGLGQALNTAVSSLSLKPMEAVQQEVASVILASGLPPAALVDTSKICLSVGYRTDNMQIGMSSALLLVVLGERAYGELLGHHLAHGFGSSKRVELALPWYEIGIEAAQTGDAAVFAPGQPERNDLVRVAANRLAGKEPSLTILPVDSPAPANNGLSAFTVSK